ncbi:hypothetical protein EGW08_002924 [Elysia chlorotica]|uniref:Ig-like domain-containing protein n=1 Tax=Elysia chlorotica TaxID=188477 RepID=A0A433U671_ELYCH|nr:hypothetical protein EGW08_002924 [Elysia chlorotica]
MDTIRRRTVFALLLLYTAAVNAAAQEESVSALPTIYKFTLDQDMSGIMASAILSEGDTPTLACSAQSDAGPVSIALRRERDGAIFAEVMDLELTFTFDALRCQDTGVYVCSVHNSAGTNKTAMDLSVMCPPQLIADNRPDSVNMGSVGSPLTIQLDVMGLPPPSRLLLTTANTETVLASSVIGGYDSSALDHGDTRFELEYVPAASPMGSVELVIKDLTEEDFGRLLCLIVENENGEKMSYMFLITEVPSEPHAKPTTELPTTTVETTTLPPSPPASSLNIQALALGLALVIVDVAIAVVVIWIICRKCHKQRRTLASMIEKREMARRQRRILSSENPRESETTVSQPVSLALSEFQGNENEMYTMQSLNLSELHRHSRLSQDGDERFSKDLQPPTSPIQHRRGIHNGIENIYYGAEGDIENESSLEAATPENGNTLTIRSKSQGERNNTNSSASHKIRENSSKPAKKDMFNRNSSKKYNDRISDMYAKVIKPKKSANKRQGETPESNDSTHSDSGLIYCNAQSPDDAMLAAEMAIENGACATEFVVLGQHRKLSLPKDGLDIYQNF